MKPFIKDIRLEGFVERTAVRKPSWLILSDINRQMKSLSDPHMSWILFNPFATSSSFWQGAFFACLPMIHDQSGRMKDNWALQSRELLNLIWGNYTLELHQP